MQRLGWNMDHLEEEKIDLKMKSLRTKEINYRVSTNIGFRRELEHVFQ